jgi:hypothetical protein
MRYSVKFKFFAVVLFICFVLNCGTNNQAGSPLSAQSTIKFEGPDYRMKGTKLMVKTGGQLKSSAGCEIDYTRFQPQYTESGIMVIVGHGFLRSQKRMEIMAQHLASWGIDVVTFEMPMDSKCAVMCGRGEKRYSRQEIQHTILGLTTAYLLWQTGIDPSAASWWSVDSPNFQSLAEAGYITPIELKPVDSNNTQRHNKLN